MQRAARHPRRAPALRRPRAASSNQPRPGLSTATAPVLRVQRAAHQPRRASARRSREPLRPASPPSFSTATEWGGDYNALHINLDMPQRLADCESLRPTTRAQASARRQTRIGADNVQQFNLDAHHRLADREPLRPGSRTRASAPRPGRADHYDVFYVNFDGHHRSAGHHT
jgi:hypothetical protein